jgi:hypothetical protein
MAVQNYADRRQISGNAPGMPNAHYTGNKYNQMQVRALVPTVTAVGSGNYDVLRHCKRFVRKTPSGTTWTRAYRNL